MSYCRFSSGDVYMFQSVYGGIECCSCKLAPKVPTVFSRGIKEGDELYGIMGGVNPCSRCGGCGCDECGIHDSVTLNTRQQAIDHLLEHRRRGHKFPNYALGELRKELKEIGNTEGLETDGDPAIAINIGTGETYTADELMNVLNSEDAQCTPKIERKE